jgi:hypothetical protein
MCRLVDDELNYLGAVLIHHIVMYSINIRREVEAIGHQTPNSNEQYLNAKDGLQAGGRNAGKMGRIGM